jgi:hypothetical protein
MILRSSIRDLANKEVLRVVENHVRARKDADVVFEHRTGQVRVTVPVTARYVQPYLVPQMQSYDAQFCSDGRLVLTELTVVNPGVVRVRGCWVDAHAAIVITNDALSFCSPSQTGPTSLVGHPDGTVLKYEGPITTAMFGIR